jgi:hypothetical protein
MNLKGCDEFTDVRPVNCAGDGICHVGLVCRQRILLCGEPDAGILRWLVERAKGGDGFCVEQLSRLSDKEKRSP